MKTLVWFLLLLSLGLNIGLGYKLLNREAPAPRERMFQREGFRPGAGSRPGQDVQDGPFWRKMMERRLGHLIQRLELTPEQADAFRASHLAASERVIAQRLKVNKARDRLRMLISVGAVDSDSVRALINAISREQSRMDSLVTETMLSEMEALDDSQRALYLESIPVNRGFGPGMRPGSGRNRRER